MGSKDYYLEGAWNAYCDECGRKLKSTEMKLRWDNARVGPECWEIRNPQDYILGIPDNPGVPWATRGFPNLPLDAPPADSVNGPLPTGACRHVFPKGWLRVIGSFMIDGSLLG